ncbi:GntR family transcriptional regulator [Roseibium polysiphoniae]|uniref:GntR family transcriptional regulator n=1 Tax=Roseibium polysiphoniae TaxID=2571221 RepID=A0A944CF37_9HYPH|nr:GntR family transcriptional regulator [Roseibium polysiphoniae]MBS8261499.1 GntR family transcriptional regulator [Roseibium polysiphoniae]
MNKTSTGNVQAPRPDGEDGSTPTHRGTARAQVDTAVRSALLTGRFIPGKAVTLRGLAQELGVSPMPVREVIQRLAAENALNVKPNGRVQVPEMSPSRFDEILKARLLLEPELAEMALPQLDHADAKVLEDIDLEIDESISSGNAESYLRLNHAFHFRIYASSNSEILMPLVESLWLQFAPFMRTVYGRVGTANLVDWHKEAIRAIRNDDPTALNAAIAADIRDGMGILGRESLPES